MNQSDLLRPNEAAVATGFSIRTLATWRSKRSGPPFIKPRGTNKVFYRRSDLEAWLEAGRNQTAEAEAA